MDDQSRNTAPDEDLIPLEPVEHAARKSCPVCFASMVPDSPVCHRCNFDERLGPQSSDRYEKITREQTESTVPQRLCRECRYDLTGLPAQTTCPECGAQVGTTSALATAREVAAQEQAQRWRTYAVPAVLFAAGLIGMLIIYAGAGSADLIPLYLGRLVIRAPIVFAVFLLCSIVWIGFDEPLHIAAIRLTSLLPIIDLVGLLGHGVMSSLIPPVLLNMLVIHRILQVVALFLLLGKVVEVDIEDAGLLAMAIIVVYTVASIYINMYTLPPGGQPWPGLY